MIEHRRPHAAGIEWTPRVPVRRRVRFERSSFARSTAPSVSRVRKWAPAATEATADVVDTQFGGRDASQLLSDLGLIVERVRGESQAAASRILRSSGRVDRDLLASAVRILDRLLAFPVDTVDRLDAVIEHADV